MRFSMWRRLAQHLTVPVSRTQRRALRPIADKMKLEELERREVPAAMAHPDFILESPQHGVQPNQSGGVVGYTPAQISTAYGFNLVSDNGAGTTIAIVDAYNDPDIAANLKTFDTQFGLPAATLTVESQTGSTTKLPANAGRTGWDQEESLDVEWAHAMAPGATILLVEANNSSMINLGTAAEFAAKQKGVVAVSMSWGGSEYSNETSYDHYFQPSSTNPDVVFINSSGDSGSGADYPSTSPNVVSVGGTTLNLASNGTWESETAWSDSGGGISAYELQPSWQANDGYKQSTSTKYRTVPDVSYDANPSTGFAVYDTYSLSGWNEFGGTSCGSPQWASIIADADQARSANGETALTNAALMPILYNQANWASDFHDITSGSNGAYNAGPGYDLVTGIGSPIVNNLVPTLAGTPSNGVTHFSISPSSGAESDGTSFPITVEALNSSNAVVTNFTGTVQFTSTVSGDEIEIGSSPYVKLPASYTFTSGNDGEATFNLMLDGSGSDTVTVADGSLSGTATYSVSAPYFTLGSIAPSPIYAGATETFTVTAYNAGGSLDTSYNGTVDFTSTYPSSTKISIGSFSNVTASATVTVTFDKAAANQSITAADSVNTGMIGSESGITVLPGAPTQLIFSQEPSGANVNAAISPAITVTEEDANNNVVTTDNSSSVTLSFGTNTTGATLGGQLTATVSGGVATFNNVTVNTAGTYTLTATDTLAANLTPPPATGTLTANSTSFAISSSTTSVIENFQNGLGAYYYYGNSYPFVETTKAAAHPGTATYGLLDDGDGNWYFREDSGAMVYPGDTVSTWIKFDGLASGRAYFGFGTTFANQSDLGTYSVVLAPNSGQFIIQSNPGLATYNNLTAVNQTYAANTWYLVQVEWSTTGNVIANLYASNGTTLLKSIEAFNVTTTPGTFAFRAISDTYFSTVSLTTGVNQFVTLPANNGGSTGNFGASAPTAPSRPYEAWTLGGIPLNPTAPSIGESFAQELWYLGQSPQGEESDWFEQF